MSFSLWCYRCYQFVSVEHVNIKYNIFRKRSCDFCYVKNHRDEYRDTLSEYFPDLVVDEIIKYLTIS